MNRNDLFLNESIRERERKRKKNTRLYKFNEDFKEARVTFFYFTNNLHLSLNLKNQKFEFCSEKNFTFKKDIKKLNYCPR